LPSLRLLATFFFPHSPSLSAPLPPLRLCASLFFLFLLFLPSTAHSAETDPPKPHLAFHGYAKASGDLTLADPYPFHGKARLQADLTGGYGIADFRAMLDLDLDVQQVPDGATGDRAAEVSLIPVELRIDLHPGPVDLSIGKQYVFWGQTDWVNPTDLFTPWDYVNISSELEDYRVAPWAVRATAYVKATSFDVVWVPWPMPHAMDLSAMLDEGVLLGEADLPARHVKNSDIGGRFSTRFAGIDLSIMGFHGLDKRPGMVMTADVDTSVMPPPPPVLTLTPTYGKMSAVGGDISWGAGPILLKGEAAYYWTGDRDGDDPAVRNPELAAVAGVTVVPVPWLNFTVQATANHLGRYDPDDEIAALEALGMVDPTVDPTTSWGIVERASVDIRDVVSIQVVGMQGLPQGDHFEMAFVSWRAADGLTVLGGVVLFGGPDETRFGRIRDSSRAFVEVKYSF